MSGVIAASRPELYRLCQDDKVDFLVGFGTNQRLKRLAAKLAEQARRRFLRTGNKARLFKAIRYRSMGTGRKRWPRSYRMIIKAEHTEQGSNVRFVVTNLAGRPPEAVRPLLRAASRRLRKLHQGPQAGAQGRPPELSPLLGQPVSPAPARRRLRPHVYAPPRRTRHRARRLPRWTPSACACSRSVCACSAPPVASGFHLASSHPWQSLWARIARRLLSPQPFG